MAVALIVGPTERTTMHKCNTQDTPQPLVDALQLAKQLERLLGDAAQAPDAHPRARMARALAQSLVDEIQLLDSSEAA